MTRPRFRPELNFPPFTYVPGRAPPAHDPAAKGLDEAPLPACASPDQWAESATFWFGVDLFNHGYYWEAHEAWESLWLLVGRRGDAADFLKGLIKLAAAGVKAREGRPAGVQNHAARAEELFTLTLALPPPGVWDRADVATLREYARKIHRTTGDWVALGQSLAEPLAAPVLPPLPLRKPG
jgi:hypothetical protein